MLIFCDFALKPDESQSSLFITQQNSNLFLSRRFLCICIVCITLALIAFGNTGALATEHINDLQETACNSCLKVLLKFKNNDPHIWKTCDFCLKLLKLEPDHPAAVKKINQIKKRLLYKRINALKKLFRYEKNPDEQSEISRDIEIKRILNNIIAILEYLKKLNEMLNIENSQETEQLNKNIEKYKKLLNTNKPK